MGTDFYTYFGYGFSVGMFVFGLSWGLSRILQMFRNFLV